MLIDIIAGARPNFMKIAPIIKAVRNAVNDGYNISFRLIHTGQHYDKKMSGDFFDQLGIPEPDINLEAGGGTQAEQTAAIMVRYEKVLLENRPDLVLVVGDVTSTMACAIAAKKLNNIKVAHVEGGIRSWDMTMPEEINRMVTDSITDYFFTTSDTANENLLKSGVSLERIFFVGNTMIDTLNQQTPRFIEPPVWKEAALKDNGYIVMTLHRPANVDEENKLAELMEAILEASKGVPIIFPVHPRTAKILSSTNINASNLFLIEPLSYLEFNYLVQHAKAVITDSGGITEETTVMGVPCMTLRDNTERPETCTIGTNELIGTNPSAIKPAFEKLYRGEWKKGSIPKYWDGHAADRIVKHLCTLFELDSITVN
ncbi:UDP-N-acetylglucosamine 2-epimerase (non-hydrolyzing) [Chitinophagaceae bacterium LB-8]|uniref:UDP-N-acetylglucosamine 2-epimerase (Non-hydrolyzing) n=1 Tax=Paraflavisolibacter caeni TaxID=2982496 RepID=A0A9X2XND5_9BACT|nr:UDP-N-acetylglucosamine 2-epimerase (non-hydrolyzing) [Paraflavisolibacter caeni]MCU7548488.1 UDP-N-acetylglucosamine 2-epimerase (non-hydrolyzing) [Paraflavisolibacter caeni]